MTANRVVDLHSELGDVAGNYSHDLIDALINDLLMEVSGTADTVNTTLSGSYLVVNKENDEASNSRLFTAGDGIVVTDSGPGGTLTVSLDSAQTLTSASHKTLRQLIHFIGDGPGDGFAISPFRETNGFPFVDRITWWNSPEKQKRIYQTEFTRSINNVTTIRAYKLFNDDGLTVNVMAIDAITYMSGVFEIGRTRTFT